MADAQQPDVAASSISGRVSAAGFGRTDVPSLFAARRAAHLASDETDFAEVAPADGRIDVERSRGVWLLTLHGDHDVSTQPRLHEQLELVSRAGGPIVVDLSRATFVDSTVIGALALASARESHDATSLALVAPANYVGTRMIELVGIGSRIPVYRTRTEAVAAQVRSQTGEVTSGGRTHATQLRESAQRMMSSDH